jgi:hypothetical protein
MLEVDAPWYSAKGGSPFGAPAVPKTVLDKHLLANPVGKFVTAGYPPDRIPLALVAIQQGLFSKMLGLTESLYPLRTLEGKQFKDSVQRLMSANTEAKGVPYVFTFHGTEDRAVPWEGTRKVSQLPKFAYIIVSSSMTHPNVPNFTITNCKSRLVCRSLEEEFRRGGYLRALRTRRPRF